MITKSVIISTNKKSLEVTVFANKNLGIYDVKFPFENTKYMRSQILDKFQGRQINDNEVRIHLSNVLYELINK